MMRRYARSAPMLRQPAIGFATMVDAFGRSAAIHDAVGHARAGKRRAPMPV